MIRQNISPFTSTKGIEFLKNKPERYTQPKRIVADKLPFVKNNSLLVNIYVFSAFKIDGNSIVNVDPSPSLLSMRIEALC